jgi:hypothetical protein
MLPHADTKTAVTLNAEIKLKRIAVPRNVSPRYIAARPRVSKSPEIMAAKGLSTG